MAPRLPFQQYFPTRTAEAEGFIRQRPSLEAIQIDREHFLGETISFSLRVEV